MSKRWTPQKDTFERMLRARPDCKARWFGMGDMKYRESDGAPFSIFAEHEAVRVAWCFERWDALNDARLDGARLVTMARDLDDAALGAAQRDRPFPHGLGPFSIPADVVAKEIAKFAGKPSTPAWNAISETSRSVILARSGDRRSRKKSLRMAVMVDGQIDGAKASSAADRAGQDLRTGPSVELLRLIDTLRSVAQDDDAQRLQAAMRAWGELSNRSRQLVIEQVAPGEWRAEGLLLDIDAVLAGATRVLKCGKRGVLPKDHLDHLVQRIRGMFHIATGGQRQWCKRVRSKPDKEKLVGDGVTLVEDVALRYELGSLAGGTYRRRLELPAEPYLD